jgi:hypothetical protein
MRFRKLGLLAVSLLWSFAAYAQQKPQPLTFWYEYSVKPGKEEEFLNLVKTVGQPVRDKLMADGVIVAWGVEAPVLRGHGDATHWIWYTVSDWSGIEKTQSALAAQIAKLDAEAAEGAGKKGKAPAQTITQRSAEVFDVSKTKDYLTRDIEFAVGSAPMQGVLPYTRYNFTKARAGYGPEYREVWNKYNKPVLNKLLAAGAILAYGLSVEEVRTSGEFTHFTWFAVKSLGDLEKVRDAFIADRDARSPEERKAINTAFLDVIDADASRSEVSRSLIFHAPAPK